jgi:hypothetical protein
VQVGANGAVELNGGTLDSSVVAVDDGGLLAGNGTVRANVNVTNGILRPGFSVGHLDVDGNYQQGANATMQVDVESMTQFDTVDVTGAVQLDGTLRIDASLLTDITPGEPIEIITAGTLTGEFDRIETLGNGDVRFFAEYTATGASVEGWHPGDLNGDGESAQDVDLDLFVFALMNRDNYAFAQQVESTCPVDSCTPAPAYYGGSFEINGEDDHRVNFDDIAGFQDVLRGKGMSSGRLMAAFARYHGQIPEPSCAMMATVASLIMIHVGGRRQKCGES